MPFTRILCPVDLLPFSISLVRRAIAEVEGSADGRVHVLHAIEPLLLQAATIVGAIAALKAETDSELHRIVREAATLQTHAQLSRSVVEGPAEIAITDAGARERSDLIVMGMHGMNAVSKACFGSTLERVLRETSIPVLALPAPAPTQIDTESAVVARVIAAIDFQQPSIEAARVAAVYASRHGAELTLLHVTTPAPGWGRWGEMAGQQQALHRGRVTNELEALAHDLSAEGDRPRVEIREGRAWEQIAASARDTPGSLVVMGLAHPGRPFARPGSVAWRVLSAGAHPVLAIPASPRTKRTTRTRERASRESYTEIA